MHFVFLWKNIIKIEFLTCQQIMCAVCYVCVPDPCIFHILTCWCEHILIKVLNLIKTWVMWENAIRTLVLKIHRISVPAAQRQRVPFLLRESALPLLLWMVRKRINVDYITLNSFNPWDLGILLGGAHTVGNGRKSKHWHSRSALARKMPKNLFTTVLHRLQHSYLSWLLMCRITPDLNSHLWCLELLFSLRTSSPKQIYRNWKTTLLQWDNQVHLRELCCG